MVLLKKKKQKENPEIYDEDMKQLQDVMVFVN